MEIYAARMTFNFLRGAAFIALASMVVSCSNTDDQLPIAGTAKTSEGAGLQAYKEAKAADDAGDVSKAIKLYGKMATKFPLASPSPQARFREAELCEQKGDIVKAFDAYQTTIKRYPSSPLYAKALDRQARMAQSAAEGTIQTSFLGLKSSLPIDKTATMLSQVAANAPRSKTASKAQFSIGELYRAKHKTKESIGAYRQVVHDQPDSIEAPEALFRIGQIHLEDADRGNKNEATLELAREEFYDYLIQYPNHMRNAEAKKLIASIDSRELQLSFDTAQFYEKTGKLGSAKVYYREVLKHSKTGKAHDAAAARLKALGE